MTAKTREVKQAKPAPTMTRAEREELRYRIVRNAYADPAIARKARGWSDERIERELGLKVTKSIPKLQTYDGPTVQRKREEYKRFEYARSIGVESKKARELRRRKTDRSARKERWRDWCREEQRIREKRKEFRGYVRTFEDGGFPESIREDAISLNRSTGTKDHNVFDEDARYGWAVRYWAYVNGWSMEYALSRIVPDDYIGDWYKGPYKKSYSN